ncbi:alpha-amylase family glycosyl hydrolase [Flavobacterium chungnamense]|uniref:Alpha-amylase family glycosyl hydrolase n=2 Tax=Flavobacterium chungnamense TaxID=706182 RepID=A0ABP7URT1_9FLAO
MLLIVGCSKDDSSNNVEPTPTPTEPVQYETPFAGIPNTSDIVMYEINERAFSTSGDFAGIISRLDQIKELGVNVIWLMPTTPIGSINSINSPYCVKDFKGVNPEFGNLENLRTLVREAHQRGMAVILDWVANHTSWDNPWIQNRSWYTQDSSGNIIHPAGTNWQDVADLNFNNSAMRLEMIKAMKYWVLTANVDGFRCDAADYVPFDFWKQAIDDLRLIPNRDIIMFAEGSRADHFTAGFDMNFGWDFFGKNKNVFKNSHAASDLFNISTLEYSTITSGKQKLRFTSNHDECAWDDTPLGLFGGIQASLSAFVISSFMDGVPLIYNGQEVGCTVKLPYFSNSPINWSTNPTMLTEYKRLINLRNTHAAIRTGTIIDFSSADLVAFKKQKNADEVFVIANSRNSAKIFTVPTALVGTVWINTSDNTSITLGSSINLSAFEYTILVK